MEEKNQQNYLDYYQIPDAYITDDFNRGFLLTLINYQQAGYIIRPIPGRMVYL